MIYFLTAHFVLYNIMGLILTEKGQLKEAIINLKKGIEINPNYSVIYNNLGTAFKSKGELILAEKQYLKSIKLKKMFCSYV